MAIDWSRDILQLIQPGITLVVGVVAGVIALYAFKYNFRTSVEKIILDRNKHIQDWGDKVIDEMAYAIALTYWDPKKEPDNFFKRRNQSIATFSSLIDRGRLFFPNDKTSDVGADKEEAFQGLRRKILNDVVAAFDAAKALDYALQDKNKFVRKKLVQIKRSFVAELQNEINPRRFSEGLADLAHRAQTLQKTDKPV
jgi:hypothetical protein